MTFRQLHIQLNFILYKSKMHFFSVIETQLSENKQRSCSGLTDVFTGTIIHEIYCVLFKESEISSHVKNLMK